VQLTSRPPGIVCYAIGYFHEQATAAFEQQMQLNYMGTIYAVKAVYADMVKRNTGHICLISSTMGLTGGAKKWLFEEPPIFRFV
jgi:short-subunit dehydrogenase